MQQYAFQNNNQINNNQQPQNMNNNNNNNANLQHQMTQAQQLQQYNQGQMNQLQQMQQQFNQFNQQQPPVQNQQNAPQNQLYQQQNIAQQQQQNKSQLYQQQQPQQQQQSPQNTQNQQMQQNINNAIVNNTFAQNQNQMQLQAQQAQQAQQAHNQNAQNPQLNVAWAQTQQFQQMPSQITQLDNTGAPQQQQQQQQMLANGDINTNNNQQMGEKAVDSKLDPEVAAFNPLGLGDQPASFQQQTIQEQLFAQLQTINTQMHNIKYQTDNVLTPTLLQLNQQMALLQSNPGMLQLHVNQVNYYTIQQNQMIITSQINRNQMTYQQLEQNLKYTQDMYHKNKDEQYVVPVEENADNQNVINLNEINNAVQGKTFNLTQGVTDVGVGGNAWTPQQQQQQENAQQVPPQPVHAQPVQPEDVHNNMQQEISTNESSEGGEDQSDRDTDAAQQEIQSENQIHSESESQNKNDPQSNDNEPIECVDDEEISSDDHENESQNASPSPSPSPSPRALHPNEVSPQSIQISPFTRKISKFGASGNKPFGYSLTTPDEAEAEPQEMEIENSTESPPIPSPDHNAPTHQMNALNLSKSVVFPQNFNNSLKSKPLMEKAASYSSQHSNDASSDTTPQIWRVQDDDIEAEPGTTHNAAFDPDAVRYDVMTLVKAQKQYLTIQWSKYKDIPRSVRTVSKGVNPERYMEDVVAMFMRKSANPWLAASHTGQGPSCKGEKLIKKLTGILNKMTPEKFSKVAKSSMDIVNDFAETREQMKIIIGLVLQFGIKQPVFGGQYALLCSHLHAHLPKLGMICEYSWVVEDKDVSQTFRKMVIQQTNDLFMKHSNYTAVDSHDDEGKALILSQEQIDLRKKKKKDNFFAVMVLVAELYNVELIKRNLVFKGVFEILLKKPSAVDLEGLCRLFKRCGAKLDVEAKKYVDKYLQRLLRHSRKFDFRTKILVEQIKEMRSNGWEHRLKKEVAKTKDEIKEDFEKEQMAKNTKHHNRGYADRRPRKRDDYYEEDYGYGYEEDYNGRGSYGHSASNLRKVKGDRYGGRGGRGGGGRGGRRRDERSRSSINLRSDFKKSRYNDTNSWGNDDSAIDSRKSNKSNGNGRYKQKYVMEKVKVAQPGKSYGMYQKKSSSGNSGVSKKSMADSVERNGGNVKGGQGQSYGDSGLIRRLSGFIDEYMVSGELSDILDFNCSDLKVWASVINDGLRDRKSAQIADFIEFILVMFEQNVLHNKGASFVDKVVKYLVMVLDESSMECPNFTKYVAELLANLCHHKYLKADACYSAFVKMYKEYSEYGSNGKKKTINKFIKHSVNELKNLGAARSLISNVQRKAL